MAAPAHNPMSQVFKAAWLANLPTAAAEQLMAVCRSMAFDDGDYIYQLGARQDRLWGVESGQVRVHVATNEMHPVLGHIHTPGAWFGEVELVLGQPAYVAMQAAGPTRLRVIDASQFRQLARRHPELWESVARLASLNLWLATLAANDMALRAARQRMAAVVLRLSGNRGAFQNAQPVDSIHATQQELADLANVARATASKALLEFQSLGYLELNYGIVILHSTEGLTAAVESQENELEIVDRKD
jgi:CRP-like cAMP-binding protein